MRAKEDQSAGLNCSATSTFSPDSHLHTLLFFTDLYGSLFNDWSLSTGFQFRGRFRHVSVLSPGRRTLMINLYSILEKSIQLSFFFLILKVNNSESSNSAFNTFFVKK